MKINALFLFLFVIAGLGSCKKDNFNYPPGTVGISKIEYFPTFKMNGRAAVSVVKGTTFTDAGVKAFVNGSEVPVTITGTVNTGAVGFYILTYSASNKDGYSATLQRIVVIIPSAELPGLDISGDYAPIGGAPSNATITKMDQGLYYTTNCWGGGSAAVIPAYFICTDGATVSIPLQDLGTGAGRVDTHSPGTYVGGLISWTVTREDFPGGPLMRSKQWQKQ